MKKRYEGDYFYVAVVGGEKMPVFLVSADDIVEAKNLGDMQLKHIVKTAGHHSVPLPFDPTALIMYDRESFEEFIGKEAMESDVFKEWYFQSRLAHLRLRMTQSFKNLSDFWNGMAGKPSSYFSGLRAILLEADRAWWNLDEMLDEVVVDDDHIVGHDPGPECFSCGLLDRCSKGKQYMLSQRTGLVN